MASVVDRVRLFSVGTSTEENDGTNASSSASLEELQLSLRADSNFRHSTEALLAPGSISVRHVTVTCYGSFFMARWNTHTQEEESDIYGFFRAIGSLPNLESLSFLAGSFGSPVTLPTELLVATLRCSTNLERLKVHGLFLKLDEDPTLRDNVLYNLTSAFQLHTHRRLSEVSFVRSFFGPEQLEGRRASPNGFAFERLVAVWTTLPNMENLEIHHRKHMMVGFAGTRLSSVAIRKVAASRTLRQLELFNFMLYEDHLEALAEGLVNTGHSRLRELSFSCKSFGVRACRAVSKILSKNTSLQSLHMQPDKGFWKQLNSDLTNMLASSLACNSSLKSLVLEDINVVSLEPLVQTMRINYSLVELVMTGFQSNPLLEQDLRTQLKLNEVGRRSLLSEPPNSPSSRSLWVDAIIDVEGDVHCIFYLLSANPTLCNDAGTLQVGDQG
jgi:hypothetical protein